jgi:isoleucyl-tRNA synthetase
MAQTRLIVSWALEKRMAAGLKVRQPLSELTIKSSELKGQAEYLNLIKDEVNVKNISFAGDLEEEIKLNTEITPELQKEGNIREAIRSIQELRKERKLSPADEIVLSIETDKAGEQFINSASAEIKKPTNVCEIRFEKNDGLETEIGKMKFKFSIKFPS